MAATKKDSLESLQAIFNDVVRHPQLVAHRALYLSLLLTLGTSQLVQTGKAVRASRKDANQSQLTQSYGIVQPKLPQTLASFHSALDRLEGDIVSSLVPQLVRHDPQALLTRRLCARSEPNQSYFAT